MTAVIVGPIIRLSNHWIKDRLGVYILVPATLYLVGKGTS